MADKSNKEKFRERFQQRNPELNMDDEDSYYASANNLMDEYEGYETSSRNMRERLEKSPALAEMLVAASNQDDFDPVIWMVENKGLDLEALSSDEKYSEKLAEAHNKYLEKMARQDEIERQMKENMPKSVDAIRAKAQELGMTDDQAEEVIKKMYQVMDDLIVGKLDPAIFEMMAKGGTHDKDVAEARDEGVAEGLSKNVKDKLRSFEGRAEMPRGRQMARPERRPERAEENPFI